MIITLVKYFAIIFWSLFIYMKSLNRKPTAELIIGQAVYSVFLSFIITLTMKSFLPEITVIFIFASSCIFNKYISRAKWNISITASVISCALSYILNVLAVAFSSIIFGLLFRELSDLSIIITALATFPVMGLFVFSVFNIKRLRNGLPFLGEKHISLLGVIIALIVFQCYTIINVVIRRDGVLDSLAWFSLLCVGFCAILVIIWWKTGITKAYKDSLSEKEKLELYCELSEKEKRIFEIEKDNAALSKIIHSDNKLIPSLENAVRNLCEYYSKEKAEDIIKELRRAHVQRNGLLGCYKKESKQLPSTKITSLDITLDYMKQKAYENNIEFDVFISGSVKYMIENLITEEQLRTISADLLENSIIAISSRGLLHKSFARQILFTVGICDDYYEIRVEDSGTDFEKETLINLGKKQTTTHKNEGGSGIGMMQAFEIMRETGASLVIERLPEGGRGFTKRVSVRFDGKNEYRAEGYASAV
ncbi:MAG: hypothetical protein FWG70_03640 [Oscillospiraceae bacterium]|nr:hypothetical protein [Oscillospiraceae bacterium]